MSPKKITSIKQTGVVTFLDVLGWKGIWQRNSNAIQELEALSGSLADEIDKLTRGSDDKKIYHVIISDTVIIFSEANLDSVSSMLNLHGALCAKIIPESIKKGIPLRGATCFGDVITNSNSSIYAGSAVDEAASWHELADWIGVFMSPSANFVSDNTIGDSWFKYEPPLKNGMKLETFVVNWIQESDDFISDIKKDFSLMSPVYPEITNKFLNTINFMQKIKASRKENQEVLSYDYRISFNN